MEALQSSEQMKIITWQCSIMSHKTCGKTWFNSSGTWCLWIIDSKYYTVPAHNNTDKLENLYHYEETWRQDISRPDLYEKKFSAWWWWWWWHKGCQQFSNNVELSNLTLSHIPKLCHYRYHPESWWQSTEKNRWQPQWQFQDIGQWGILQKVLL